MTDDDRDPTRNGPGGSSSGTSLRRATMMEIRGYQSIYRFVFRRPGCRAGAVGFSYHQPVLAILIVLVSVSAIELVVVDVIVRRWTAVRIPLLILGVWGLVYMLGLLFGMLTRPHAVGPDGIRVRSGSEVDIPLAWDDVYSVARRTRATQEKQPKVTVDDAGNATLHLRMQNETNIDVGLERPIRVRLPHGTETVSGINLYADDPKAFMNEVSATCEASRQGVPQRPAGQVGRLDPRLVRPGVATDTDVPLAQQERLGASGRRAGEGPAVDAGRSTGSGRSRLRRRASRQSAGAAPGPPGGAAAKSRVNGPPAPGRRRLAAGRRRPPSPAPGRR